MTQKANNGWVFWHKEEVVSLGCAMSLGFLDFLAEGNHPLGGAAASAGYQERAASTIL